MDPFGLKTPRLVLDQPNLADVDLIAEYASDPVFEAYMATPWPYERHHAESFVGEFVPGSWASGSEWTWAIREASTGPLLGMIGIRLPSGMLGFWLGAPHRGSGIMSEAVSAVVDAVFERTDADRILWECVLGNEASLSVARKTGFRFTGSAPGMVPTRTGESVVSWTAELRRDDSRVPKSGWPT